MPTHVFLRCPLGRLEGWEPWYFTLRVPSVRHFWTLMDTHGQSWTILEMPLETNVLVIFLAQIHHLDYITLTVSFDSCEIDTRAYHSVKF